jgi:lipopolysaccharide transport system permease protein
VFSVVFQARWGVDGGGRETFAIILFVGILVHGLFAECVNRAPTLILGHGNYVKRVVFPLEILPLVTLVSALFHTAVSLAVLLLAQLVINGSIPWTAVLFPLVLAPLVLTTLGFTWLLAGFGVYVRDIGQVTTILTMVMLFLAPVFYPISALPERYQRWIYLNPLTFIIEQARVVLLWGGQPDWAGLGKHLALGAFVAWLGFWSFQKLRRGFADVL